MEADLETGEKARLEAQAKRLYPDHYAEWTIAKEAAEGEITGDEVRLTDRHLIYRQFVNRLADHLPDCGTVDVV